MANKRRPRFDYGEINIRGIHYYRAFVRDKNNKRIALYGKTLDELCDKVEQAEKQIKEDIFRASTPTVKEYAEKWLLMQSAQVRPNTMIDYTSKVKLHIIKPLGNKHMGEVTADDIKLALVAASKKSASVFKSVVILYKCIFTSAKESHVISSNPTVFLSSRGKGIPQKEKEALTDEQAEQLLAAIKGLPPYVFVMLGLYAGLRREEILGLKWESVFLDTPTPFLQVCHAWHTEHNRPIILEQLKTAAARRSIPLPEKLAECLREARKEAKSAYVVSNSDGEPLSYTQFKRLWHHIVVRIARPRPARKKVGGKYIKYTTYPKLGEKARNNGHVTYCLDFEVTPHQLRHTYITNLIHAGVDPKTVQYLAGHESSKITMDIYAKVKYNRPEELINILDDTFAQWDEEY